MAKAGGTGEGSTEDIKKPRATRDETRAKNCSRREQDDSARSSRLQPDCGRRTGQPVDQKSGKNPPIEVAPNRGRLIHGGVLLGHFGQLVV